MTTSASACAASRALSTKQFSVVMNQWNFSNHSGTRALAMPIPVPLLAILAPASLAFFSAAATARLFCASVLPCFASCFFFRSKCSLALA